jgi:hypothetical protein
VQGVGYQAAGGSGPQQSSIRAVSYTTQDRHVPTFSWRQRPQSPSRQQSPLSNTATSLAAGSCRSSAAGMRSTAAGVGPSSGGVRATSAGAATSTAGARSMAGDCRPSTAGARTTTAGSRSSMAGARSTFGGGRGSDQDDMGAAGTSSPVDINPWQVHQRQAGSRPTTAFFRSLPRPTTAPAARTCDPPAEAAPVSSSSRPVPSLQLTRPRTARGSIRWAGFSQCLGCVAKASTGSSGLVMRPSTGSHIS